MGVWDRLAEATKALASMDVALAQLQRRDDEMTRELQLLREENQNLRERLTKLETQRENDRAQARAEIAEFKLELERAAATAASTACGRDRR